MSDEDEDDPFEVEDVDETAPPPEFKRPKGLLGAQPTAPGRVEVKSGAAGATPPPLAPGPAKNAGRAADAGDGSGASRSNSHPAPTRASTAEFDVKQDVEKRTRPTLHADPGEVVIHRTAPESSRPKPQPAIRTPDFDVVVDAHAKHPRSERLKVTKPRKAIGIVDTTFARTNMGAAAADELAKAGGDYDVLRRTVPGIKDLAVECKILIEEEDCDLVVACGMVGGQPIDKQCAHEASLAIQWAMLATNRHILEAFVHEDEAADEAELARLMERRARGHALNAHWMVTDPTHLPAKAGQGLRQGFDDAGPIRPSKE